MPSYAWQKEPWTSDDKPFIGLRQRINRETIAVKGNVAKLRVLVARYEVAAKNAPLDAKKQYAWASATLQANQKGLPFPPGFGFAKRLSLAMAQPKSPRSYQYDRLRFVFGVRWQQMPGFGDLALRLLKRNQNDSVIQFHAVSALFGGTPLQRQQALRIAQQMVKAKPKEAASFSALGNAYWGLFIENKQKVDGDRAIAAIKSRLALNPQGRAQAEDLIVTIRKLQAKPGFLKG